MKAHQHRLKKNPQAGQAILTAVIFFLAISLTIVLGVATPILQAVKVGNDTIHSKASYFMAEGALEDAVYRAKAGKTVNNGDTVTVNGYTTTISVTSGMNGDVYEASSNYGGLYRNMAASVSTGQGISFSYGLQTGAGGFYISGGSKINGSVYSNGPVFGNGGGSVTGSASSADSASLTADQSNPNPASGAFISSCTSSSCIVFGNTSASQDVAQQFQVSQDGPLHDIQFYLERTSSSPANITVRVVADNAGSPGSTDLLTSDGSIAASSVGTSFSWVDVTFPSNTALYAGETYWVILDTSNNSSKYYTIGANSGVYTNGMAKTGTFGGTWSNTSPAGLDEYFNLYLGGAYGEVCGSSNGLICNGGYVGDITIGSGGVGDAWAHQVSAASVSGNMYCQVGGGSGSPYYDNVSSCNITKGDPAPMAMPISDGNIADWENDATIPSGSPYWTYSGSLTPNYLGTTTSTLTRVTGDFNSGSGNDTFSNGLEVDGNMTVSNGSNVTTGPLLVKGNLTVDSTGLVMNGTVWVQGNLTVTSGGSIQLGPSYGGNSGVIVVTGYINLGGGSSLLGGDGNASSYLLLVTPSDCPISPSCAGNPAITISGGSGAIVLEAPHGTINMNGGTEVSAMASDYVTMSGGATLTYKSGVASLDFVAGPTGGWNVSNWQEVQ